MKKPGLIAAFLLMCASFLPQTLSAQFEERAAQVGVDHYFEDYTTIAGGVALFDMNNDNLLDIYLCGGLAVEQLYINNGISFDRIVTYLQPEDFDYLSYTVKSASAGDLNNDGFDDLILGTIWNEPLVLYINDQNGKFDAMHGSQAGIENDNWSVGATMGDIDKDGLLDVFVSNYIDTFQSIEIEPGTGDAIFHHIGTRNNLFINQGSQMFDDMAIEYGTVLRRNTLTSAFTDFDNDGDADIHVVNDFGEFTGENELYRNEYPSASVDDVSMNSGADLGFYGMGIAIGDFDGDLDLDYYMTNIGRNYLLRNNGDGTFTEWAEQAGITDESTAMGWKVGWGTGFLDYDNDGDLDLYISNGYLDAASQIENPWINPNSLYRNNGNGTFTDVSVMMDFDDPRQYRGAAFGDLDNDGLLDIVMVPANSPDSTVKRKAAIFYNVTGNDNNWVKFKLEGAVSNRSGFGAHVYLYDNSGRVQLRECDGGSSHASSNSPYIHFGIGTADAIDSVVVKWPAGIRQRILAPSINQLNIIDESDGNTAVPTGIALHDIRFDVWPNPFYTHLEIEVPAGLNRGDELRYDLIGIDGRGVLSGNLRSGRQFINTGEVVEGMYFLKISDGQNEFRTEKIVKKAVD